ncbi:MAG: hypothetical protein HZC36_09315 [Armatimonadetes bacterium]|nr:hypothetical protein [Armatimonadota bacterium]
MVKCSCGRVMDKVPSWLQGVKAEFVCNNCPDRKTKNIAFISLEPTTPAAATPTGGLDEVLEDEDLAIDDAEE